MKKLPQNLLKFKNIKFNPSVNEWRNSIYSFNKYSLNTYLNEKVVSILLNSYFNLTHFKERKFYSLRRIVVGQPDIRHNLNNIIMHIYVFNKEKLFYLKRLFKLKKIIKDFYKNKKITNLSPKYLKIVSKWLPEYLMHRLINIKFPGSRIRLMINNKKFHEFFVSLKKKQDLVKNYVLYPNTNIENSNLIEPLNTYNLCKSFKNDFFVESYKFKYNNLLYSMQYYNNEYNNKNNIKYIYKWLKLYNKKGIYTRYLSQIYVRKLYLNNFKFNFVNLTYLSNIIHNIYNKKVLINIINVKYLHLDSSLFIDAIVRKLRDRNKRVLKVLRKALTLSKIPRIHPRLLIKAEKWDKEIYEVKEMNPSNYKDIMCNNIVYKAANSRRNNIFLYLKNTHIIGIWLEGKGRLTRRLTASRAVHKRTYVGTMKNIFSSYQGYSSMLSKGYQKSNIDYINMNSYNRNGSFGIKSYQTTY